MREIGARVEVEQAARATSSGDADIELFIEKASCRQSVFNSIDRAELPKSCVGI
jgi:hypothetical protein